MHILNERVSIDAGVFCSDGRNQHRRDVAVRQDTGPEEALLQQCSCHGQVSLRSSSSSALFLISMDPHFGRLDPDPDPGGQKIPTKIEKKFRNFMF
jgi:hypothetical protein